MEFVGELPPVTSARGGKLDPRFDALTERPGEWALYWGSSKAVWKAARHASPREGFRFEGTTRNGAGYIRAVKVDA